MHPHHALVQSFYEAFQRRDGEAMAACYAPAATFSDPVFPSLEGEEVGDMWRMLTERGKDLKVEFEVRRADDAGADVHWEAWYTFSATKRKVHNVIDASFTFQGGKILTHEDRFDLWRWTRMALGPTGVFLGWAPPVKAKIRAQAAEGLRRFRDERRAS